MSEIKILQKMINQHLDDGLRVKIYLCKDFQQAFDAISVTNAEICSENFLNILSGDVTHLVNIKFITNISIFND
ncbi:hypothetical protein LPB140_02520 [Sphingorhabdus lutea]|uniref:Uncharacterized protein n=1 Tax=Sphingorhabdus lutea TaxID=1913578 RepID=A0A1L3J9T5_9SPHN|nr:hypothetical protein [Sphingorhabdus lutea]APG61885.1 hypothetical protein LPB140_02520 [Sphingorhabdus lutea]